NREGIEEFEKMVPDGSTVVIESSTTGKALSMALSGKYQVHMVSPPERKSQVKTDKRDAVRIMKEDELGYLKRCYVPSQYIENLRVLVARQMELGSKISEAKNQVHALIERNMMQDAFEGVTDIFGVAGLHILSSLELPEGESEALAMYLQELNLYVDQHKQLEAEMAGIATTDEDCRLLMTIPGVGVFVAVAIKSRIGDISRFPDKKKLCSYVGLVPKSDNSCDYVSSHRHVKYGDDVLKAALTTAVRGAVSANAKSTIKKMYLRQVKRGKTPKTLRSWRQGSLRA
ncbi:MAG: transposase, partial [Nitrososphaerota archaeon]|nr:transposase [Nitrososphaerota archaeon]